MSTLERQLSCYYHFCDSRCSMKPILEETIAVAYVSYIFLLIEIRYYFIFDYRILSQYYLF